MFSIVKMAEPPRNASRLLARPEGGSEIGASYERWRVSDPVGGI